MPFETVARSESTVLVNEEMSAVLAAMTPEIAPTLSVSSSTDVFQLPTSLTSAVRSAMAAVLLFT